MSRRRRLERFQSLTDGRYIPSLMTAGEHRAVDSVAISNWCIARTTAHSTRFGCRGPFGEHIEPAAFLTATPDGDTRTTSVAVAAICRGCWIRLTPEQIEAAALGMLRKNLNPKGRFR
jgi:hypothetical protein